MESQAKGKEPNIGLIRLCVPFQDTKIRIWELTK